VFVNQFNELNETFLLRTEENALSRVSRNSDTMRVHCYIDHIATGLLTASLNFGKACGNRKLITITDFTQRNRNGGSLAFATEGKHSTFLPAFFHNRHCRALARYCIDLFNYNVTVNHVSVKLPTRFLRKNANTWNNDECNRASRIICARCTRPSKEEFIFVPSE